MEIEIKKKEKAWEVQIKTLLKRTKNYDLF